MALRTVTVKSSGGDYTSLSAAEAGEQGNLVSLDRQLGIECYSMADTTVVDMNGSTTDATRYIRIYTPTSERHDGKWNTNKYRLELATTGNGLRLLDNYTRVEGLQVQMTASSGNPVGIRITGSNIRVSACLMKGVLTGTADGYGVYDNSTATTNFCWNCVSFDWINGTIASVGAMISKSGTLYASNITVQNCRYGFYQDVGTFVAKNCLAQDCTLDGFAGTFDGASTNNCSDIASDAPGSNPSTGEVLFVDESGDNFHVNSGDTVAKGLGADLSADANLAFSDDIDGQTRSVPWDIGADKSVMSVRTVTVKPSGGDYTSLSAAEAGEVGNLVSLDRQLGIECYSMSDTTTTLFSGWTTDATRYIRVYTPSSERHDGKWNTAKYRITVTGGNGVEIASGVIMRLEGLQIHITATAGFPIALYNSGGDVRVSHCVIRGSFSGTAVNAYGVLSDGTGSVLRCWNTVVYDITGVTGTAAGIATYTATAAYIANCTVQNCDYGFIKLANATSGVAVVKNCLAQDGVDGFLPVTDDFDATSTNNCSDIASDAPGSNPSTGEVTFVDEGNDDFHLAAADTVAKGFGATLSADANLAFSDDIDGVPRVVPWDIGADQTATAQVMFADRLGLRWLKA